MVKCFQVSKMSKKEQENSPNNNTSSSIIGTWDVVTWSTNHQEFSIDTITGVLTLTDTYTQIYDYSSSPNGVYCLFNFDNNDTLRIEWYDNGWYDSSTKTFVRSGNNLSLYPTPIFDGSTMNCTITTLTQNNLNFSYELITEEPGTRFVENGDLKLIKYNP